MAFTKEMKMRLLERLGNIGKTIVEGAGQAAQERDQKARQIAEAKKNCGGCNGK